MVIVLVQLLLAMAHMMFLRVSCGFPLISLNDGSIEIKRDLVLSEFARSKFDISIKELESEREAVKHLLK